MILLIVASPASAESKTFTNSIGMEFVLIPAGSFMMGIEKNAEKVNTNEMPPHKVTFKKPFYMGKYEVTQAQWTAVMGANVSIFKGSNLPVESVSWEDAQSFVKMLNRMEGKKGYRLPTEAEWEYACRASSTTAYSFGNDTGALRHYAWYDKNSDRKTHPVGQLKPNAWGVYDMHGNVWEWCQDWYGSHYYADSPLSDPKGPSTGSARVVRGGSWRHSAGHCRSAFRGINRPGSRHIYRGFRLGFSPGQ